MRDHNLYLLVVVVVLIAVGRLILGALRARAGIPKSRVLYSDTGGIETRVLLSSAHGLKGKPDYVLAVAGGIVPVEIKSGRTPRDGRAHHGHVMQLAAYSILCEERFRNPVPYGIVRYSDGVVRVPFTSELRRDLLELLGEMRSVEPTTAHRNHSQAARCARCSFLGVCDEALV